MEKNNQTQVDEDVIRSWKWFMSFISEGEWQRRKASIEKRITLEVEATQLPPEYLKLVVREDLIGWYLYLLDVLINEPHKYEYFQGARIVPIFKSFGVDLDKLKNIGGIEKRIKDLLKKRPIEADAFLFEFLTALLWARNEYQVSFFDERKDKKTPDLMATKDGKTWNIECKRQSKTADYTYKETAKRGKMISYVRESLLARNILLDIIFHVELETLPDTFLKDVLEQKLPLAIPGKIISNAQVDIDLTFVDIPAIRAHLKNYSVKHNSPMMNSLIGKKPVDNKAFTGGSLVTKFERIGEGEVNNLYIADINNAFGVYWSCDAKEAFLAKARDIKKQVHAAMQQFNSEDTAVLHIGMETYDGPAVERARFEKIKETIEKIDPRTTNLRWIFCHFFQSYSPPDQLFVFDETVSSILPDASETPPLTNRFMIVPEDGDTAEDINHWDRPLPK